jgi:hypothetical protein
LVAFKKRFGHCNVPMKWREDRGFAHWVSNQRIFKHRGSLVAERIEQLNKIGIRWNGSYQSKQINAGTS